MSALRCGYDLPEMIRAALSCWAISVLSPAEALGTPAGSCTTSPTVTPMTRAPRSGSETPPASALVRGSVFAASLPARVKVLAEPDSPETSRHSADPSPLLGTPCGALTVGDCPRFSDSAKVIALMGKK